MPAGHRPIRPALFYLLLFSLGIGLLAQGMMTANVDMLALIDYFQWETAPSVNACPVGP
ncbi:MAG: hypothetical protein MK108_01895 [Mariniblastus sp.]|nr:hypothetical protein [Mariniblastus sp.]